MIVVQCWDDAVTNDIRLIEILRKYNAKACFNINAGLSAKKYTWNFGDTPVSRIPLADIKNIYQGFDIANHSLNHPHPIQISETEWKREVLDNKKILEDIFGFAIRGFAYPHGEYNDWVKAIVRDCGHYYARTVNNAESCFPPADPMAFHPSCHFANKDFWDKFNKAKEIDGVFYFWGHSYEINTEAAWAAFEEKIEKLSHNTSVIWKVPADLFSSK